MLPPGKPLTVVLLGKTGNGKSATGNTIIGREAFEDSPSGSSVTKLCKFDKRSDEREIGVIDTPGIMDTAPVSKMDKIKESAKNFAGIFNEEQQKILREICKIFAMSPWGLDAIILTIKYGSRFGLEDGEALKILQKFLGEDSKKYTIVIFTYGDQAKRDAKKKKVSIDDHLTWYIGTLPPWVQSLMTEICNRKLLFNNNLDPEDDHDAYQKQLSQLIQMVDETAKREKSPFKHKLNLASGAVLEEEIKKAMKESGLSRQAEALRKQEMELKKQLADKKRSDEEKKELERRLAEEAQKQRELKEKERKLKEDLERRQQEEATTESGGKATQEVENTSGGCYSASSIFVDINGRQRQMDSLQIGEQVQVLSNNEIRYEPVVTFIHRQPELMQEFLQITTLKNKVLKITEDHLLFVEKMGEARAIPARDVKIGDVVYVRACQSVESDQVHSISTVFEKGAYAPVTLSGTILVNDVHTSCYFDVLSHDWSQRAMAIARAVYHVSPGMLQWLSSIGQQDGFPGWCRLVHKTLTLID